MAAAKALDRDARPAPARERFQARDQERPPERSRERDQERARERDQERPRERDQERARERDQERARERDQERPRERDQERPRERPQAQDQEPVQDRPEERPQQPAQAPQPPAKEPAQSLFRAEALEARRTQAFGVILLEPKITGSVFAYGSLAAIAAVVALLTFGSYTRRAHVNGWLKPNVGIMRVYAPQAGVATRVFVHEGETVAKGAPLARVSSEVHTEGMVGAKGEVVAEIGQKVESLQNSRDAQDKLLDQQAGDVNARVAAIRSEEKHIIKQAALQRDRVGLAQRALERMREMRKRDLIALPRLEQAQQDLIDQSSRLEAMEQQRLAMTRERMTLEQTAREMPLRRTLQTGELDRSLSATKQELAEADMRREVTLTAPEAGVATGIQVQQGGAVTSGAPLMSVVPSTGDLEAQLFASSRAVGFIKPGQQVLLRYQAYPYEKFGAYKGTIASISRSALSPAELPPTLAGMPALTGAGEALYSVTVKLERQSVMAYGEATPLKAGLALEADVLLDSRRLIEWVFDPLYSLTGSWR